MRKTIKIIAVVLIILLLGGMAAQFGYNMLFVKPIA